MEDRGLKLEIYALLLTMLTILQNVGRMNKLSLFNWKGELHNE